MYPNLESYMLSQNDLIIETQEMVLDSFSDSNAIRQIKLPDWVHYINVISSYPEAKSHKVLGQTGIRLKTFADRINTNHPDLESCFEDKSFAPFFKEVADILSKDVNVEKEFLEKNASLVRAIQQPKTRLLKHEETRHQCRNNKKDFKNIGLKSLTQVGEDSYFEVPSHFKRFARYSNYYHEELKELQRKQELFSLKNMNETASCYTKRMRQLEESISDTIGFRRIKPDEASIILAKLHGFLWNDSGCIQVSSSHFESDPFWVEGPSIQVDDFKELKKSIILNTKFVPTGVAPSMFHYQPRMYPYSQVASSIAPPTRLQKIINFSEKFPYLNNCSFFDYYWVLIPGINVNNPILNRVNKENWEIKEGSVNVTYSNQEEVMVALDLRMVKNGSLVPVVIGERDGKCYYVSLWA